MADRNNRDNTKKQEPGRTQTSQEGQTPVHLTSDSTLQSPEEHEHDAAIDPNKDQSISVSRDDLREIKAGRITGKETKDERETRNNS